MEPDELPPATPELVAVHVLLSAHWRSLKPAQRLRFQRALSEVMTEIEHEPLPLTRRPGIEKSRTAAVQWLSRAMRYVVSRD